MQGWERVIRVLLRIDRVHDKSLEWYRTQIATARVATEPITFHGFPSVLECDNSCMTIEPVKL